MEMAMMDDDHRGLMTLEGVSSWLERRQEVETETWLGHVNFLLMCSALHSSLSSSNSHIFPEFCDRPKGLHIWGIDLPIPVTIDSFHDPIN